MSTAPAPTSDVAAEAPPEASTVPPAPATIEDTGLSQEAVADLLLKTLYVQGVRTGQELADALRLPFPLLDDLLHDLKQRLLLEVRGSSGHGQAGYRFDLSATGRDRAREAMDTSLYVGPAPVPLKDYARWIRTQSVRNVRLPREQIQDAMSDLVIDPDTLEALGPAVNSSRSLFLYGAPGNGKTAMAERIAGVMGGDIYIPYAVDVDGQVVVLFDPLHHVPIGEEEIPGAERPEWLKEQPRRDLRFVHIRRPTVFVGGELTLELLDLQYDRTTKMYKAPFQLKAAGGVLILDDFGRQRVEPRELLNRWVVPLEKGVDYLSLHTGVKFPVPFDCLLIFATNLDPSELVEEAFLRRIHYKIRVGSPDREGFEQIFRDVCVAHEIPFSPVAVDFVYRNYYDPMGLEPRGCHPRDLLDHVQAFAQYEGIPPALSEHLLDQACQTYFLVMDPRALREAQARSATRGA